MAKKNVLRLTLARNMSGERHPCHKLTETEVLSIRRELQSGEKNKVLSLKYNISPNIISAIKYGRLWTHLIGNSELIITRKRRSDYGLRRM